MLILSMNVDQKSLEIEFSIAICRPTGDKWHSKTLFLTIFFIYILRFLRMFSIAAYQSSGVLLIATENPQKL